MMRFLRRVFILLVLFCIIFLAFRFIKPDATRNFVSKVKAIPQTISSRFHRDAKVVINSNTVSLTWDIANIDKDTDKKDIWNNQSWDTGKASDSYEDLQWLQELNAEIEAILQSGKNETVSWNSETGAETADENKVDTPTTWWDLVVTEIKPQESSARSTTSTQGSTPTNSTTTNTTTNNNNAWNNKWWLSQQDYNEAAQIMNMFD